MRPVLFQLLLPHEVRSYRLVDQRVSGVVELGRALLHDNADHVAACGRSTRWVLITNRARITATRATLR